MGTLSCALTLALACGDDTEVGAPSGDTETGTTSEDTTTPPPPTTGPDTTEGTTEDPTEDPTDTSPETGDTDTEGDDTETETGDPSEWGTCQQGCRDAADCCPAIGAGDCPDPGPDEWTCTDEGLCEKIGCTEDAHCSSVLPPPLGNDLRCRQVDGVGECVLPCADDVNCQDLLGDETCSGVADDNSTYCAEPEEDDTEGEDDEEDEGCRSHTDCDGFGLCHVESGECYCTESIDCTDETYDTCVVR